MAMTNEDFALTLTDKRDPNAETTIDDGLRKYNESMAGYTDWRLLDVLASDPNSKTVVGGLLGRTSLGLFFVDLFFVPEIYRGCGIGSRILEKAEEEAKKRGCSAGVLFTITFQAPGFYERHGYRVLGRIECPPPGHTRLCMSKTFRAESGT